MRLKPFEVDAILEALYGHFRDQLTPWESDFIGSVQAQWQQRQWVSDKQERVLERIWDDFSSGRRMRRSG